MPPMDAFICIIKSQFGINFIFEFFTAGSDNQIHLGINLNVVAFIDD